MLHDAAGVETITMCLTVSESHWIIELSNAVKFYFVIYLIEGQKFKQSIPPDGPNTGANGLYCFGRSILERM